MTVLQLIITIAALSLGTMLTRFLPFLIFRDDQATTSYIRYLGRVLPSAIFGMLVVYCLKNVSLISGSHGIPEALALIVTLSLHKWKHQMLVSIAGGTIFYMILIQAVFI